MGYDGSDGGRKAFDVALALSAKHGAELWIVTVAQPPAIGDEVETEAVIENSRNYHRRMLAELRSAVTDKNVKVHYEVAVGHPAEQIIYHADQHGVDLIVVGEPELKKMVGGRLIVRSEVDVEGSDAGNN